MKKYNLQRGFTHTHSRMCDGFTLIEMMVAVALFAVVMTVSIGALLSLTDASRKAQAIQSVMNNLNVALDGTVRALRMGTAYEVANGGKELSFAPFGVSESNRSQRWVYTFSESTSPSGEVLGRIYKTYKPTGLPRVTVPITAAEVDIDEATFYITGTSASGDVAGTAQPRVLLVIRGRAGIDKQKTTTTFDIQASATQRILDL